jgi:hypothetical protein
MGLFDFLKPKKDVMKDVMAQMSASFFPKGEKDINAVTDAVLHILSNKISREEAKNIALKSVGISRISKEFSKERLKAHLAGYCLQHFNDKQVETFHGYLSLLTIGSMMFGKTPSEIVRDGDTWVIPK